MTRARDPAAPTEDQRLVLLTAAPGTATAEYLELLRVVGQESFA